MEKNQTSKYQHKVVTVPNILSFFRLCLIPVFVWLYSIKDEYSAATAVLFLSGATDIVDGFIARRFNMISDFGKALDPVADKLTQIVTLFCLCSRFRYMMIPLIILIVKEVFSGIVSLIAINRSDEVQGAVWHGKLTTVLLYSTIVLHIIWWGLPSFISNISILLCGGMLIFSGVLYAIRNFTIIKKCSKEKEIS